MTHSTSRTAGAFGSPHVPSLRAGSQNHRIVSYLSDGREHEMRAIHQACGFMRLNSRISELRSHGYGIDCRREGTNWFYRLVGTPVYSDTIGPDAVDSRHYRIVETPESPAGAGQAAVDSDAWATRPDNVCAAGSGPVPVSVAASDLQLQLAVAA